MQRITKEDHGMNDRLRAQYLNININIKSNIKSLNPTTHFLEALRVNPNMIYALKQEAYKYQGLPRKIVVKIEDAEKKQDLENVLRVFDAYPESHGALILTANILGMHRVSRLLDTYRKDRIKAAQMLQEMKRAEGN